MATHVTLEERVNELEAKVSRLLEEKDETPSQSPWWEAWFGAFNGSQSFDDAMHYAAQYRRSQPNAADNPEAIEL